MSLPEYTYQYEPQDLEYRVDRVHELAASVCFILLDHGSILEPDKLILERGRHAGRNFEDTHSHIRGRFQNLDPRKVYTYIAIQKRFPDSSVEQIIESCGILQRAIDIHINKGAPLKAGELEKVDVFLTQLGKRDQKIVDALAASKPRTF